MPCTVAVIDHPEHGRLLFSEAYCGEGSLRGGCYRWGYAAKLLPDDTLESLRADDWDGFGTSRLSAILNDRDESRPIMYFWPARMIAHIAASVGL